MTIDLAELRARELRPDAWIWISPHERRALIDAVEAVQTYFGKIVPRMREYDELQAALAPFIPKDTP